MGTSVNEDQTSTTEPTNASSSKSSSRGGGNAGTSGQSRGRATLVCQECKRQKSGCDRKKPCGTCVKKNTVDRCVYSAAAAEKVDAHTLNTRTTEIEAILGAFRRGVPIDFTPTYPPAVQAMEERIAAYAAQGSVMNSTPRHDHHDAVTRADTQPLFLCGPVDIARSYGCALSKHAGIEGVCACDGQGVAGKDCLRVKEEVTSDVDEVTHSTGSSAMSGISTPTPASSKAKGKRKMSSQVHASSDPLASSARRQNAQAFLPPVGVYYSEHTPSASTAAVHGIPVSNPEPRTGFAALEAAPPFDANTQHLPQDPVNPSTTDLLPVPAAPSPLASQRSHSSNRNSSLSTPCHPSVGMKLVKLVRKRWEVKDVSLAPSETLKRDRSTLEAEDREGEDCRVGSNESDASICQMEFCSDIVEEETIHTNKPQQHSGRTRVDWTQAPHYHSITAPGDFGPATPRALPNPRVTLPPTLPSSLSAKIKKSKEKVPKKQKHPVIRVRPDGITGQQVGFRKQHPKPPRPLFTSFARNFMVDGTLGPAEEPLNLATAEPPGHCPATGMHIPSMSLVLPENFKSEHDNGAATDSMSLVHYSTPYTSSNAMVGTAHPHYRGEAPHTDTASRHPQHLYAPAPPFTPIYTTPHPQSPSPANANYLGQQLEPQPYSSGYYEEQSMAGHLGSSTEWSQTSKAGQTQTHEQGYM